MSNGCVVAALGTRSNGNRCGDWTLASVDHIAMVYILSVCVCGLVMVIYVVSFNSKSCCPFSTRELTNPDCLKNPCVSLSVRDR